MEFTRESFQTLKRILPAVLGLIVALNFAAPGFGVVLARAAGLSMLDRYVATSPGSGYAVLDYRSFTGSTVTFIMAAQSFGSC